MSTEHSTVSPWRSTTLDEPLRPELLVFTTNANRNTLSSNLELLL
jgi:hypothetical protein